MWLVVGIVVGFVLLCVMFVVVCWVLWFFSCEWSVILVVGVIVIVVFGFFIMCVMSLGYLVEFVIFLFWIVLV